MTNALFICSRNQWRSPTAETLWRKHPSVNVRSAGTSPKARKTVTENDIAWADMIFVMEKKHKSRLVAQFSNLLSNKQMHVLDIPDDYQYMDSELIAGLEGRVTPLISQD